MAGLGFNPLVDPTQTQNIDQQRQFAQLLRQQAMQDEQGQMVSGRYVAPSITQGLARLLKGYTAGQVDKNANDLQTKQYQNQINMLKTLAGGGNAGDASQTALTMGANTSPIDASGMNTGGVGPTLQNAKLAETLAPTASGSGGLYPNVNMSAQQKLAALMMGGGDELLKSQLGAISTPDSIKTADMLGIDRGQQTKDYQGKVAKENYIPPTSLRGQAYVDSTGMHTLPDPAPAGYMNTIGEDGKWSVVPVNGGLDAVAKSGAAQKQGVNQQTLLSPEMSPRTANGQVIPTPISTYTAPPSSVNSASMQVPPEVQAQRDNKAGQVMVAEAGGQENAQNNLKEIDKELANKNLSPTARGILQSERNRLSAGVHPQGVGLALGQEQGASNAQTELTKKYGDLQQQNSQAQITTSYLQNIKQQAQKAATGPMASKIDFVNGLLSLVGNQKASDAVTANDLLEKYSNQIVSRLGTGGLGTDAARAIIQSAYPNSHMNLKAINEAADNLVGANEMVKAKMNVLSQHGNARDPVAYQQKEQIFDQNADPRVWQWRAIQNPADRKAFAASVIQQDPTFPQKIKALESIGAIK